MAYLEQQQANLISRLNNIDVEDLQYVERDLCFYQLVSLGFLLYGEERGNAEFVLQRLLVLSNTYANDTTSYGADLLRKYASLNIENWRAYLVEALAIIGARRVLRKLGFQWEELYQHYLPHIAELSLHVHPLLKALYKLCERLRPAQAGQLVLSINEQRKRPDEHLRFYDFAYLEVFLLDWITRRIISVGDRDANGADVQALLDYFKLNEMDAMKQLLIETINHNAERVMNDSTTATTAQNDNAVANDEVNGNTCVAASSGIGSTNESSRMCELSSSECYTVRRESAGIILIINQVDFYEEQAEEFRHLLPKKKLERRRGTEVDKERLKQVFTKYGYHSDDYNNLSHIELMHRIRETVKRSLLYDSLILCILSHGTEGTVYGNNSIPVKISDIEDIVTGDTLQGKPKLLIIQACQKDDSPVNIEKRKTDNVRPDYFGDMIKAMSTVPGYASMRHTITGTWFIQSLCDAVERLGDRKHILDILIAVNRDVSEKRGDRNEIMMPMTSNTLRKYFFLPQHTRKNTT